MAVQWYLLAVLFYASGSTAEKFHIRPSSTTSLSMAEIRGSSCSKHDSMYDCLGGCLQDPCCVAVKLQGECEMSYCPTEAMDLVKEAPTLAPIDKCSCSHQMGGGGGNKFSFEPQYAAEPSQIGSITFYLRKAFDTRITVPQGVAMIFASGQEGQVGVSDMVATCALVDKEIITATTVYTQPYGASSIVTGVKFVTTLQTCGPYGTETADVEVARGHQLLFLSGGAGALLDVLTAHFDYGCSN